MLDAQARLGDRFIPEAIGVSGFDMPDLTHLRTVTLADLGRYKNIIVDGSVSDTAGYALLPEDFTFDLPLRLRVSARTQNAMLIIGQGSRVFGHIRINGKGLTAIFAGIDVSASAQYLELNGENCCLFLGRASSSNGLTSHVIGQEISICIGEGLLAAHGSSAFTSDMHALIDCSTGRWVNQSQSIPISPHVWLAERSTMLKGSSLGFGSVLGLGSVLTGKIDSRCVAAGVPAVVVRRDATWLHHSLPTPGGLQDLADLEARLGVEQHRGGAAS